MFLSLSFQQALLQQEAEGRRSIIVELAQRVRPFTEEVSEVARRLSEVIQQIEGGVQVVEDLDGIAEPRHVSIQGLAFLIRIIQTKIISTLRCPSGMI